MADINKIKPGLSAEALAKAGYKETKVGWIPEEWEVFFLRDAFHIRNTKRKPINKTEREKIQGEYPYYGPTKIQDYINEYQYEGIYAIIAEDGDHFLKYGQKRMTQLVSGKFNVNNHAHVIQGKAKVSTTDWFYWYFYHRNIYSHLTRQGAGRYKLNKQSLEKIPVALPPLPEQRQIATLLSTWDTAIDKLGQLIAKKQALKKGLMQQLLSGRVRFPEFVPAGGTRYKETKVGLVPEDWAVVTLDELGSTYSGLSGKSKKDFGEGARYIPYKNVFANSAIDTTYFDYVEINEGEKQNQVKYGDIFFTVSSETPEEVGMSSVLLENIGECYLNSFCFGFRLDDFEKTIPEYLRFSLRSFPTRKAIARLAQGATRYNLSKRNVMKVTIALPSKAEQERIASVLTGLYNEIRKLEKTKMELEVQKKGLMQQLLTGAVRTNTTI